jgi:AraC-like DNA-binding protein
MPKAAPAPSIPAVHALHLVDVAARWNVGAADLLAPLGLDAAALAEPGARLTIAQIEALVARARALTGEPGLGFHLGLQMRISSHGYLGFAAMASATAREALELAMRFAPTRTSALALRLIVDGARASLVLDERAPLGSARDVILLALVVGIPQLGEVLTGRPLPGTADLAIPEPPYARRFARLIDGRIRFGQPVNQLVFDAALLDLPMTQADPAAVAMARAQCERELAALGAEESVAQAVRRLLALPGGGFRPLDEVARALAMSPRTLKRRLADEDVQFSALLDDERRERALLLLRDRDLSLDQIAERVGYADVANFTRAFRRWTGTTPARVRDGV